MDANDFQILIAPVIGTVAAMATGWVSLYFILRREKYLQSLDAKTHPGRKPG